MPKTDRLYLTRSLAPAETVIFENYKLSKRLLVSN